MRTKRFLAVLLCYAMIFSTAAPVNAAAPVNIASEEDGIEAFAVETEEVLADGDALTQEPANDAVIEEETVTGDSNDVSDNGLSVEDLVNEDEKEEIDRDMAGDPTECLKVDASGKLYIDGYSSLASYGNETIVVPKETKRIPADSSLFMNNTTVKTVQFESGNDGSELIIEAGAFAGSNIEYFYAPNNYRTVSSNTFSGCSSLIYFNFNTIEDIGDGAFSSCRKLGSDLSKLKGYKNVTSIGKNAFSNTGFVTLTISDIVAPKDVEVDTGAFSGCNNLNTANIPAGFKDIPDSCFEDCVELKTVNIKCGGPIGKNAFKNCKKLVTIDFGKITAVEENAFLNCIALVTVEFPDTLDGADGENVVKTGAFNHCEAIKTIRFNYNGEDKNRELIEDNAFPEAIGVNVKGYLETLKKYVEKVNVNDSKKWTYTSLQGSYTFSISERVAKNCGVKVTVGSKTTDFTNSTKTMKIAAGTQIGLTISQKSNKFGIVGGSLSVGDDDSKFTFISYSNYQYVYYVKMPEHDAIFDFETFDSKAISRKYLHYEIEGDDTETQFVPYGEDVAIDYGAGKKGKIVITSNYDGDTIRLCEGLFTYKSSNTGVATVDKKTGAVSVLKEGNTTITATYKDNANLKLTFVLYSNGSAAIDKDSMAIEVDGDEPPFIEEEYIIDDETVKVNVVRYDRNELSTGAKKFKIKLKVMNEKSQAIFVNAKWTSSDTKIAKLSSAENMTNSNTVTIPQWAYGEANITASVKYKSSTYKAYMVIRVVDSTPKVVEGTVSIKSAYMAKDMYGGAQLTIVPVAGFEPKPETVNNGGDMHTKVYQLNAKSGKYEEREGFELLYVDKNEHDQYVYRLIPTGKGLVQGIKSGKTKEFTDKDKLYIRCIKDVEGEDDYYIPINKVQVTNTKPTYKLKMTGTINLHYNALCYYPLLSGNGFDPEEDLKMNKAESEESYTNRYINATVGEVVFKNPIPAYEEGLRMVELVSKDHYTKIHRNNDKYVADPNDKLAKNFDVWYDPDLKEWHIRRSGNELEKEDGKDVVSGYVLFYYYGLSTIGTNDNFLIAPITIPTKSKAPKYYLSTKSVTDSAANMPAAYRIKFQNDLTKNNGGLSSDYIEKVELDKSKDHTRFNEPTLDDEAVIELTANRLPEGKSVARINVKKTNWEKFAGYDFTVNVTIKDPTVSVSPKKLTLNSNKTEDTGDIKVKLNQIGTKINLTDPEYIGKGSDPGIDFGTSTYGDTQNIFVLKPSVPQDLPAGSYKYKTTVSYELNGKAERVLKTIKFTVAVNKKQPILKLKSTKYTFNFDEAAYAETEVFKPFFTVKNMTVFDKEDLPDAGSATVVAIKPKASLAAYAEDIGNSLEIEAKYDEDKKKPYLEIKMGDISGLPLASFSFNYEIRGITMYGAEFKPVKVTVKGTTKAPAVTLTAAGKLNTLDDKSCRKYTMTVKNFSMPVVDDEIEVLEYDPKTGNMEESTHFYAKKNEKNQLVTELYAFLDTTDKGDDFDEAKCFEPGKSYEIQFKYKINGAEVETKTFKVKPVQTKSEYTLSPGKLQFVSTLGSDEKQRQRATDVLTKKTVLNTHVSDVKINDSNPSMLKNAFTVTYVDLDEDGEIRHNLRTNDKTCIAGHIVVECVNPELLTKGKTYKLKVDVETDGQAFKEIKRKDKDGNYEYVWEKVNGSTLEIPVVVTR